MADNFDQFEQSAEQILDNTRGPGAILAEEHKSLLFELSQKAGKYTGLAFKARKEPVAGVVPVGTFFWNSNALNTTTDFTVTFSGKTADLNDPGLVLNKLQNGDIIHFKDYAGRSAYFIFKSVAAGTDSGGAVKYDVVLAGVADNSNYIYQAADDQIAVIEFLTFAVPPKDYEIQFVAPNFILLENGVPKTTLDLSVTITETIEASETSLTAFLPNNGNYTYQQGDVISIVSAPDNILELYLFKGGTKTTAANYQKIDVSKIDWSNVLNKPSNLTDVAIKDSDGIVQFNFTDELLFENIGFDPATKKLIGQESEPNIFIRGVQNEVTSLSQMVLLYFQPLNTGGSFTTAQIEQNFKNFKKEGDTVSFVCLIDIYFKPRFGSTGNIGENCTHFLDYSGRLKSLPFQQWRGSTKIEEIILSGATSLGSNCVENCTVLTKLIAPLVTNISNTVVNCGALTTYDFTNVRLINGSGLKGSSLRTTITEFDFPNVTELGGQGTFSGMGITSAIFPKLKKMAQPFRLNCNELVVFKAPMLEEITSGAFWECSSLLELDFPLLTKLFSGNPSTAFWDCSSLTLLNIPNCVQIGSTTGDDGDMFNRSMSQLTINVNEFLKTSNAGNIEPELQDALNRGAKINFTTSLSQSFKEEEIDISTTYADDASASTGGVEVGKRYVDTNGNVKVRLT